MPCAWPRPSRPTTTGAFSNGSGGVCIEFDKDKLIAEVADVPGLRAETVQYRTIRRCANSPWPSPTCRS